MESTVKDHRPRGDHPHADPGDGRQECHRCGKWVWYVTHSCKGVPVTPAAMQRMWQATLRARIEAAYDEGSQRGLDALDCDDDRRARIQTGTYRQHRVDAILAALAPATRDEVSELISDRMFSLPYGELTHDGQARVAYTADALLSRWAVVSRGDGGGR